MNLGGCVLLVVFCISLYTPIWCGNYNELGGLRFVVQHTSYPKDSNELEGLHFMGGVSHHALHPDLVRELQQTWGAAICCAMNFAPQEQR